MKKQLICAGLILGLGALAACGSKETGTVKQETSTESVSITETTEAEVESTSETPTTEEAPQEEMATAYLDAKGSIYIAWTEVPEEYHYEHEYDENGNLVKSVRYNTDGSSYIAFECEHDASGNEVKRTYYKEDGSIEKKYENEYDASGNEVKHTCYEEDGSIGYKHENEYDAAGNLIKVTSYNEDGSLYYVTENQYNDSGQIMKDRYLYYDEGSISYESTTTYEYDDKGNGILSSHSSDGEITDVSKYENTYDDKENLIKVAEYQEDVLLSEREIEYNENGAKLKDKTVRYDYFGGGTGTVQNVYECEYDENGNMLKSVSYDADGSVIFLYEYEYIEMQIPKKFVKDEYTNDIL